MAEISTHIDDSRNIVTFVIRGTVTSSDIVNVARQQPEFRILNHLVDMTKADLSSLDSVGIQEIVKEFAKHDKARQNGRTAVVVAKEAESGLVKLFATMSEVLANSEVSYKTVFSHSEALEWLSPPPC
ncbi:MAG: hypothetical protein HOE62_08740 [Alphaproteobacteria bacterium]|jgi:hypothetical protein|nr:hypothetical protein [Alphaproteobacteria bacterium]MBT4018022.1 hypothetical protein [Alphaproteobacteria bacterium]MBT4967259.1 hypothetical protein [Alphaproteobacteria bacterium]MBT5160563.1 hypothetical protein [Alphaproteobacteria bacterium]MBT5917246.1 hypothetical protein [Alphaproteobacteria bacterium]